MPFYERLDLIDFPCSPTWHEHYADEGMTPGYPADYYKTEQEQQQVVDHTEELNMIRGQLAYIMHKLQERDKSGKKGYRYE